MAMAIVIDNEEAKMLVQAQAHIWNHIFNFLNSMSLKCAVQLGIPDVLHSHGKPMLLSELVLALGVPQSRTACLHRLMRMLVHSGFFSMHRVYKDPEEEEEEEKGYVLTPSSRLLLKDNPLNVSQFLIAMLDPVLVTPWHFLSAWFQGNGLATPFEATNGRAFWNYGAHDPEYNNLFNVAMANDARLVMSVVLRECEATFQGLGSLVDVGGGTGAAAMAIADKFPQLKCIVFDLPHVVGNLVGSKNLDYVGGDMFDFIPHADAVLLKWILHDWSDEECVKILKRCREAIPCTDKGGRVIIIDMVIGDNKMENELTETQLLFDMLMMGLVTGRERSKQELEKLLLEAGFTHYKIIPILGLRSLIEVYP
ncbi:PREDICTED: trans-resveratrol di-O-methyltransferase-like [Nelumbo nucifera]|uniref:Trans-resveratrol di-O-methyltransferase-like n=2 Tax=Nelumbo nucifera TaxID=4432 RepID=A0A1U8ADS4_NELNU|nr:PREDICTED: trans-resveratrol di-O-methyltransferase-like [Nelumbo nucifera]DAD22756.1 TPA_asm: hypothetical protein HUJ06_024219 [Nelumbo nucifera]